MKPKGEVMKRQTVLKITLLAILAVGLSACSASKQENSADLSSRATETDTTKAWIQCNAGTSDGSAFDVRLAAVTENGVTRNDLSYVRFSRVPSDFTTSNQYFQMFRWQANTSGSIYVDQQALAFEMWDPQTNQMVLSSRTSFKWSDVATTASGLNISDASTFLKRVVLKVDLRDPTAQFDALMSVLYKADNTPFDVANALIPVFDANPENYQYENGNPRHSALTALHPFKDRIGQGWTTADFQSWANSLCASF